VGLRASDLRNKAIAASVDEQFGKSAEKQPNTVMPIGRVEAHCPLDRGQCDDQPRW
jgi:hypothetical protein